MGKMKKEIKPLVLIVDDNLINLQILGAILKKNGYATAVTKNGIQALDFIQTTKPDIILLDIIMPEMDGFETCKKLKEDKNTKDIPVIFITSLTDACDKVEAFKIGGVDYITKPFMKEEVLARVKAHLNNSRLVKELFNVNKELSLKQEKINEDLIAAAGIQRSLLPKKMPNTKNIKFAWKFIPSDLIGGDIFNVFTLDDENICIYTLDVSGHGVPSALVTVSVSQTLQPGSDCVIKKSDKNYSNYEIVPPKNVLESLDQEYPIERFGKFFTIFYSVFNFKTKLLRYCNAAHPPPVLLRPDKNFDTLEKGGTLVGLGGVLPFEEGEKRLKQGDKVIIYTDGITEYKNKAGEFYGDERLFSLLESLKDKSIKDIIDNVFDSLMKFGDNTAVSDDVSLLGFEITFFLDTNCCYRKLSPAIFFPNI